MNSLTQVRRLIRSEAQRASAPAVRAMERDASRKRSRNNTAVARQFVGTLWHCYLLVSDLRSIPAGDLVLPQDGHKYQEAHEELLAAMSAGAEGIRVVNNRGKHTRRVDIVAFLIVFQTVPGLWRCLRSPRLRPYANVLFLCQVLTRLLRRRSAQYWLIIGDLSPFLIALAAACKATGHQVVYWQYSFLDFKHMPVCSDIAVILNDRGRKLAVPEFGGEKPLPVYWRPRQAIVETRLTALEDGPIGAMLNVHADENAIRKLQTFSHTLNRKIEVRLHPNSSLAQVPWPEGLTVGDPGETLENFARRHAVLLCGNTQAQAKALADGTLVIHCAGLDPLEFDHHGYVGDGILAGCKAASSLDLTAVRGFFASGRAKAALEAHMGPEPTKRKPNLEEFLRDISEKSLAE